MASERTKLFADFKIPTKQEWLDKIHVDLKGADFNKKLVWRTSEGFSVQPFYQREDIENNPVNGALPGTFPYLRGNKPDNNAWLIRQDIDCDDAEEANRKVLDLLNRGVNALGLHIPKLKISKEFIETLLQGITLEAVELNFKTCQGRMHLLGRILTEYFSTHAKDIRQIKGSVNYDPIMKLIRKGKDTTPQVNKVADQVHMFQDYPLFRSVAVNGITLSNAGAYCYQELGYALSLGNECMQRLTDAGIASKEAAANIKFEMGIGSNYFMEIAKFRAARMLWAYILREYGVPEDKCTMYVNATTTEYNKTLFDSYVNLLRTQTETMSAALAGVDSITVTPFDSVYAKGNAFSERLARNQQLLLKEECHFDRMADVAAGSYHIETLTTSLAHEAWKLFLAVEDEGGFLQAAQKGLIQQAINTTNAERHANAAKRREYILGTNQFPNFSETSEGHREPEHATCSPAKEVPFAKLQTQRLAHDFEAIRIPTEESGKRPVAFMLTIGNLVMRQARAQFSCNFLACAGYRVIDNLGFSSVEEGVKAALEAKADIVVLCSSDDEYAQYAIPAFQLLKGKALFIVAGAPACSEELKAAGIENFIHVRVNQLETLRALNAKLGIS